MKHLPILLSACILWALPLSLSAQKNVAPLEQVKWLIFEKEYDLAEKNLQSLLQSESKKHDELRYWLGMIALYQNDFPKAKSIFSQQIEAKEKSPFSWAGLGHLYAFLEDFSYSESCLSKAKKYGKHNSLALNLAIAKASMQGQADQQAAGRVFLVTSIDRYPTALSPKLTLFQYYQNKEILEPAISVGEELLPLVPHKAKIFVDLAELNLALWKISTYNENRGEILKTAYRNIQEAFADDPNYPDAFRVRAELYIRSNFPAKFQKARDDMASYLNLKSHDQAAKIQYAKFLFLTEDYTESLDLIGKLQNEGVENTVLLRLQGIALSKIGELAHAKTVMEDYFANVKAEYRISKDYETYGDILRQMDSPKKAQSYYQLAIDLDEERVSLYGELADTYLAQAQVLRKQRLERKKEGRTSNKLLSELIAEYNVLAGKGELTQTELEKSEELSAEIQLIREGIELLSMEVRELENTGILVYEKEAFYREKALIFEDALSLRNQRKYADALFNSRQYDQAEQAYIKVHELKEDYLYPYEKRLQIALRLAKTDGKSGPGMKRAVPVSQDIIRVFLPKVDELKTKQQKSVLIALESMAVYSFDPEGENDCQAAQPYLAQLKDLNQAYFESQEGLQLIDGYCEE